MSNEQKLREALRFTKKPVTIEAVQFTEALRDAILFDGEPCPAGVKRGATTLHLPTRKVWRAEFFIPTLEGAMNVSVGDWIIKGVKGEYYPCKPDIFAATYEPEALALPTAAQVDDINVAESFTSAAPVGERELFERTMMDKFGWERQDFKTDERDVYMDGHTVTAWMTWQARAALSAQAAPMTRKEVDDLMTEYYPLDSLLRENVDHFENVVRAVEAHRGIQAKAVPDAKGASNGQD